MRRLRQARWELGSILPPEITTNLINPEIQWFQAYNKILATYMRSIGDDGLNITNDVQPPKSLYVEVYSFLFILIILLLMHVWTSSNICHILCTGAVCARLW